MCLKSVNYRAKEIDIKENSTGFKIHYACVQHFIDHLRSHIKSESILIKAERHYFKLFINYSIEFAMFSLSFTPPAYRAKSFINVIIHRMMMNPQVCNYYQKKLQFQNEKFHLKLEKHIQDKYQNLKFKLKTHTEITLLNLFHQNHL